MSEEVTIATADMRRIAELQAQLASAHEQLLLCEADDEMLRTVALAYLKESSIQERGRLRVELRKLARAEHPGQALADEVTRARAERQRLQADIDGLLRCGNDTLALLEDFKAGGTLHTTIPIWDDLIARWQEWMATEAGKKARD